MAFPSSQLFVGHLHPDTSHKDFERRFGKYGKMKRCEIKKGYGFIEYEDIRDAEDAIKEENEANFQGNRIVVEWAKGSTRYQGRSSSQFKRSGDRSRYRDRDRDDYDRDRRRRRSPDISHRSRRRKSPSSNGSRSRSQSRSPRRRD